MCTALFVLTPDNVYWSMRTDSHEAIMEEYDLGGVAVARVEVTPPDGDLRAPLEQWHYDDREYRQPDWYDRERDEARVREALADWYSQRVIVDRDGVVLQDGAFWVIDSHVEAREYSHVEAYYSSHVVARWHSHVEAYGSSYVEALRNSRVEAYDDSRVDAWDDSHVTARGRSHVEARERSYVEAWEDSHVEAYDDSHVVARGRSTVTSSSNDQVTGLHDSAVEIRRVNGEEPKIFVAQREVTTE